MTIPGQTAMIFARALYGLATELSGGDRSMRCASLVGALVVAIGESTMPADTLEATIATLRMLAPLLPTMRESAFALPAGGDPS